MVKNPPANAGAMGSISHLPLARSEEGKASVSAGFSKLASCDFISASFQLVSFFALRYTCT